MAKAQGTWSWGDFHNLTPRNLASIDFCEHKNTDNISSVYVVWKSEFQVVRKHTCTCILWAFFQKDKTPDIVKSRFVPCKKSMLVHTSSEHVNSATPMKIKKLVMNAVGMQM
jgi:hypothetical protein